MGEKTKTKIFVMDVKSGEVFEFEPTKSTDYMLKESVPDGINIHITGSQIDKISNIDIYFEEEK